MKTVYAILASMNIVFNFKEIRCNDSEAVFV